MTDEPPSLWREDEGLGAGPGQGAAPRVEPIPASAPAPRSSQSQPVGLWREEEGRPSVAAAPRDNSPKEVRKPGASRTKEPSDGQHTEEKQRLLSWRVVAITVLLLLIVSIGVDGALVMISLRRHLSTVASHLGDVEATLSRGDLPGARSASAAASRESERAKRITTRPSFFVASQLPEVRQETDALRAAVQAADLSSLAAESIVAGANTLGLDEDGVPNAIYLDGQVQLDTVSEARTSVNRAELALVDAVVALEGLEPRLPQVASAVSDAHARLNGALDRVTRGRTTFDLLPGLLGEDGSQNYLLALQTPGEARGTGGLMGMVGVLNARDGALELENVLPGGDIFKSAFKELDVPEWFRSSYERQGALVQWQQANTSPNYPVVSDLLLKMFEKSTGRRLDGVLAMDPLALAEMMKGIGPIEIENPATVVNASNVADLLLRESYVDLTGGGQDKVVKEVVDGFWERVSEGQLELKPFVEGLATGLRNQHVKLYSREARDQRLLTELDLDGNYDTFGPHAQMAFNNNYSTNKVDYYLHREVDTEVELQSDGTAEVTTTLRLDNRAPDGPPSVLLGQGTELAPGVNRMTINLLMPPGSQVQSFSLDGQERAPFTYMDDESPVLWDVVTVDPGSQKTVTVEYSLPGAVQILGKNTVFDFVMFPQTTVNADTYGLSIKPPPGSQPVEGSSDVTPEGTLERSGTLDAPVAVRLEMEAQ